MDSIIQFLSQFSTGTTRIGNMATGTATSLAQLCFSHQLYDWFHVHREEYLASGSRSAFMIQGAGKIPDGSIVSLEKIRQLENPKECYKHVLPEVVFELVSASEWDGMRLKGIVSQSLAVYCSAKIPEIWIINPIARKTTLYAYDLENEEYTTQVFDEEDKHVTSVLFPDLVIDVEMIYNDYKMVEDIAGDHPNHVFQPIIQIIQNDTFQDNIIKEAGENKNSTKGIRSREADDEDPNPNLVRSKPRNI
eukprot:TRINITY_DN1814_c0_g1_i2.p1 TRINITY_DN1814_c0_g1~~TRINITY_DN1814_c0_g1_i2.p1  ORF type:complete len:249 (+),score=62.32 TRINITY_DN1814_c0_g1_i2:446-1192(+)